MTLAIPPLPTTDAEPHEVDVWGHILDKPPRHSHETPWHQDEARPRVDEGRDAMAPPHRAFVTQTCSLPSTHWKQARCVLAPRCHR